MRTPFRVKSHVALYGIEREIPFAVFGIIFFRIPTLYLVIVGVVARNVNFRLVYTRTSLYLSRQSRSRLQIGTQIEGDLVKFFFGFPVVFFATDRSKKRADANNRKACE